MKKINTHLLSTRAILIFHVAAQELNFTDAANKLNIGQSAVSHGVRQLEDRLGVPLFQRRHKGVALTFAGEKLARRVQRGFQEIEAGLHEVQAQQHSQQVTLLVSTSLASHWLMPRIAHFKQLHPKVSIRCITQDTDQDLRHTDFDLCIPLGQVSWQGHQRWKFVDEALLPVYSPEFQLAYGAIDSLADLAKCPLIHLEERYRSRFDWVQYFHHFDYSADFSASDVSFNDYSIVVQAALEGQGVALGWQHIVQPLIDQGRLCTPSQPMLIKTNHPFYLLAPEGQFMRPATQALLHWLLSEMRL